MQNAGATVRVTQNAGIDYAKLMASKEGFAAILQFSQCETATHACFLFSLPPPTNSRPQSTPHHLPSSPAPLMDRS